jgi:hypothetical protein
MAAKKLYAVIDRVPSGAGADTRAPTGLALNQPVQGGALQVDSINARVESTYGIST